MNKELVVSPRALAMRTNGVFSPTDRGHLAQELVLVHKALKNHLNPAKTFAMSKEYTEQLTARKEELCGLLGLPLDERIREKKIQGLDGYLVRVGLPFHRVGYRRDEK